MGLVPAKIGEVPVKNKIVYASLAHTLSSRHLKPEGYELISLSYDFYYPSAHHKVKEAREIRFIFKNSRPLTSLRSTQLFSGQGVTVSRETDAPNVLDRDACTDSDNGSVIINDIRAFNFMESQYQ